MKRMFLFLTAAIMCLALASCGTKETSEANHDNKPNTDDKDQISTDLTNEDPSFDMVGPWHLDEEKTDIDAIESAWETFPGYAEWGAGMEIKSDGSMSWYVGAVGGSGTYAIEGDIMHTALLMDDGREGALDLMITEDGEMTMTYADMEMIWAYGAQEEAD